MTSTEQLRNEHQAVLLALNILEKICQKLKAGDKVDPKHQEEILEFIKVFVDKCHHGKEEDLLFPAMEKVGIPKEQGPIGMMLAEHDMGREFVREMSENIPNHEKFIKGARGYTELLRQHIEKEDNILYQMADMHISKAKDKKLLREFDKLELERIGKGKHEEFHKLLETLNKFYSQ
ncbi:MAG: cytoplasmic protein [Candidatus Berkelbacteria bacterium]|nr:cytoplasmic protein [Candidatus Berkelbacteria bacterium]